MVCASRQPDSAAPDPRVCPAPRCAATLLMVQLFLTGFVEMKRYQDFLKPKSQGEPGSFFGLEGAFAGSGENGYPGGVFDPMGLSK